MKRAIVFPGQGSQQIGMGRALAGAFESARMVFEEVDDALGQKLSKIMFEGPEADLTLTENAQPAIMASSMAVLRVLQTEGKHKLETLADYFAGHSLGEYTALCAAKALTLADTARLLKLRGKAMQKAVPEGDGAMAALLGYTLEKANAVMSQLTRFGICSVANDNSPEQVVISGTKKLVGQAAEMAKADGASKAVMLQVSAPFHCALMKPAADAMRWALDNPELEIKTPSRPVIANVTAQPVHEPDEIRKMLVEQVCGMVRWRESVQYLASEGVEFALELGTGKVLAGLIRRTEPKINTISLSLPKDIEEFRLL